MISQISMRAIVMGLLAAFVGYASSFAIVLAGLTAMGASAEQAASGLFFAALGMGVCSIWLSVTTRTPAAVAWSTPGAAFLASTNALPGGFAEATGAFILCACLIVASGLIPALGRVVAAIPKPVASALLAGVLLNLCFAPALALGSIPLLVLPVLGAWLAGLILHKLAAMPFAVIAFATVLWLQVDTTAATLQVDTTAATLQADPVWLPTLTPLVPLFTIQSFISVSIPLYLVTMAGQNIPGFTLLELNRYPVERPRLLKSTGLISLLIAPFGTIPVNMSAIVAGMMCSDDAGHDPARRYWAATVCGVGFVALAFSSVGVLHVAGLAPPALITAVAGLALIPALVASVTAAFSVTDQIEAPALTFLITASGMTLLGVSGAFWGVVAGVLIWILKQTRQKSGNTA